MNILLLTDLSLPITNPVIKFLIILLIILFAPLILNRIKIPHILGLIIAGAVIGPYGFNLIIRDSSIILSGTAGLLYIMFLAGLEMDYNDFIKNSTKSIIFGLYTFIIPMCLGILTGIYILKLNILTSILLASMFASHTLITYPIITKLGVKRNRAVTITVGGTMITDTLALIILAVIVGISHGTVDAFFWIKLTISVLIFGAIVLILFPIIARLFLKNINDGKSQYIFVLVMVFLGASLAELAGIEAIIGAFLSGLALNRLIPHSSALMNRIDFIGNAIFIPFFLISVGMLIDYRIFLSNWNTILTAVSMTIVATLSKYIAAFLTQKTFKYNRSERDVIFGLSNAQAAATLAAVMVGFNVITGYNEFGEPIRLLNESILNGTIIMIFFTCTIASFASQSGARKLSLSETFNFENNKKEYNNILIPISNPVNSQELLSFAFILASDPLNCSISVANIIDNEANLDNQLKNSKKIFDNSIQYSSGADRQISTFLRYDINYTNGIINLIREHGINDLILGIDPNRFFNYSTLGKIVNGIIKDSNITTYILRNIQPIQTLKRQILIIPPNAELELGFRYWVIRIWNFFRSTSTPVIIYGNKNSLDILKRINNAASIKVCFYELPNYKDLLIISKEINKDDGLIFIMSRRLSPSYNDTMENIPHYINTYFNNLNFILIYPFQQNDNISDSNNIMNPSSLSAFQKIEDIVDSIINKMSRK